MNFYYATEESLNFSVNGELRSVPATHENYEEILKHLRKGEYDKADALAKSFKVEHYLSADRRFRVEDGAITFDDQPVDDALAQRVLLMMRAKVPITPIVRFLTNLSENPSYRSREQLYLFLENCNLPITEDGCFMAYKRITKDYKDVYTQTISNAIGETVSMARRSISDDPTQTCHIGLHVCSLGYLKSYSGDVLVAVKVNPRDVVSVPVDMGNSKMRVCEYQVVSELDLTAVLGGTGAWNTPTVTEEGFEIYEDEFDSDALEDEFDSDTLDDGQWEPLEMSANDLREFAGYLATLTNNQVLNVYDQEVQYRRHGYAFLAEQEAKKRGLI